MNASKGFLSTVIVIGAAVASATASSSTGPPVPSATLTPLPVSYNPTRDVVTIGVRVAEIPGTSYPAGDVDFRENFGGSSNPLGHQSFVTNCQAVTRSCDYFLQLPGYAPGSHTITAGYGGVVSTPTTVTFTIFVSKSGLSWLPAVLDLLDD